MREKYLTLEQNMCAARIFLNNLGLSLENVSDINEYSKIKIFDKAMNEVGKLYFDNGKVIMSANYNGNILDANYDISKMSGFIDIECGNALFSEWSSKIDFQIKKENTQTINGEFLITCSVDSEFGINCFCHPLINCISPKNDKVTLKMLRNGRTFGLEINSGDYHETIDIMPYDELNGFIKHIANMMKKHINMNIKNMLEFLMVLKKGKTKISYIYF